MALPQTGIFALGNPARAYLEFDLAAGASARALIRGAASLTEPRTTMGGVNLVAGVRPELWATVVTEPPRDASSFTTPVGFCARQQVLTAMLESMAGLAGEHDALTRYSRPLTGAYYCVPALEDLAAFAPTEDAEPS